MDNSPVTLSPVAAMAETGRDSLSPSCPQTSGRAPRAIATRPLFDIPQILRSLGYRVIGYDPCSGVVETTAEWGAR